MERDEDRAHALTRAFDRRRLLIMVGKTAAVSATATGLVQAIAAPASATSDARGGIGDKITRRYYSQYDTENWRGMQKTFDQAVVLTVPDTGFPFPGTYKGPDDVASYFKMVHDEGMAITLHGVAGIEDYSLAVHDGKLRRLDCAAALVVRFTAQTKAVEVNLFGFTSR